MAHRALLLAAALALACLPLFAALPQSSLLWRLLHDTAHAPVFAALAVVLLVLRRRTGPHYHRHDYGRALWLAIGIGGAIELIQIPVGRDAEWVDLARDALGALTGLGVAAWLGWRRGDRAGWRISLGIGAVLAAVLLAAPVAWALAAYGERYRQWPVVADFDSPLDRFFVSCDAEIRCEEDRWQDEPVLRVEAGPGAAPGAKFIEPTPDWRGFDRLQLDLVNPGVAPFGLKVRVHDRRHNQEHEDRYNQQFVLAPGSWRFVVPLERIARAPRGRRMDLGAIQGIVVFADAAQAGRTFLVRRIVLLRATDGGPTSPPAATLPPKPP